MCSSHFTFWVCKIFHAYILTSNYYLPCLWRCTSIQGAASSHCCKRISIVIVYWHVALTEWIGLTLMGWSGHYELWLLHYSFQKLCKAFPIKFSHLKEISRVKVIINTESLALVELKLGVEQPVELFRVKFIIKRTEEISNSILLVVCITVVVILSSLSHSLW